MVCFFDLSCSCINSILTVWYRSINPQTSCDPSRIVAVLRLNQWRQTQRRNNLWQVRVETLKKKRPPGHVCYFQQVDSGFKKKADWIWDTYQIEIFAFCGFNQCSHGEIKTWCANETYHELENIDSIHAVESFTLILISRHGDSWPRCFAMAAVLPPGSQGANQLFRIDFGLNWERKWVVQIWNVDERKPFYIGMCFVFSMLGEPQEYVMIILALLWTFDLQQAWNLLGVG